MEAEMVSLTSMTNLRAVDIVILYDSNNTQTTATATSDSTSNVNVADVLQSFLAGLSGQGAPSQGNQMSDAILNALRGQINVINSNASLSQQQKDQQVNDLIASAIQSVNTNPF
jgi:hypothetical protein